MNSVMDTNQLGEDRWGRYLHEIVARRQTLHHALSAAQHHARSKQLGAHQRCVGGSRYLHRFLSNQGLATLKLTEVPLSIERMNGFV